MIDPPFAPLLWSNPSLRHRGSNFRRAIAGWFARYRERAQLRRLSDDTLADCGLSRADIEGEIRRLRW